MTSKKELQKRKQRAISRKDNQRQKEPTNKEIKNKAGTRCIERFQNLEFPLFELVFCFTLSVFISMILSFFIFKIKYVKEYPFKSFVTLCFIFALESISFLNT